MNNQPYVLAPATMAFTHNFYVQWRNVNDKRLVHGTVKALLPRIAIARLSAQEKEELHQKVGSGR